METYGLPYPCDKLGYIKENGCVVDMSNLKFPGIMEENKIKTAFIYLRNTDFDKVILNFDNCSSEDKYKIMDFYIFENIENKNILLATTTSKIFNYLTGKNTNAKSILTDEEVEEYIKTRMDKLGLALRLLISLPVYLIKRYKIKDNSDETLDMSYLENIDDTPIGINLKHIIMIPGLSLLYNNEYVFSEANYTKIFTMENNELFDKLQKTVFGTLLLALSMANSDEIKNILDNIELISGENNG